MNQTIPKDISFYRLPRPAFRGGNMGVKSRTLESKPQSKDSNDLLIYVKSTLKQNLIKAVSSERLNQMTATRV